MEHVAKALNKSPEEIRFLNLYQPNQVGCCCFILFVCLFVYLFVLLRLNFIAAQQFLFRTKEESRFARLRRLQFDHNALRACNHNAVRHLTWYSWELAKTLGRKSAASTIC